MLRAREIRRMTAGTGLMSIAASAVVSCAARSAGTTLRMRSGEWLGPCPAPRPPGRALVIRRFAGSASWSSCQRQLANLTWLLSSRTSEQRIPQGRGQPLPGRAGPRSPPQPSAFSSPVSRPARDLRERLIYAAALEFRGDHTA
jgi:hypothetical protein